MAVRGRPAASRSGTERSDRAQGDLDALQELTLPTRDLDDRESFSIAATGLDRGPPGNGGDDPVNEARVIR